MCHISRLETLVFIVFQTGKSVDHAASLFFRPGVAITVLEQTISTIVAAVVSTDLVQGVNSRSVGRLRL